LIYHISVFVYEIIATGLYLKNYYQINEKKWITRKTLPDL
jgi:hypothetical protein